MGPSKLSLDVGEIGLAIDKSKISRKQFNRAEFRLKPEMESDKGKRAMEMTTLSPINEHSKKQTQPKNKKIKKGSSYLATGFWPNIDLDTRDIQEILRKCRFEPATECVIYKSWWREVAWKISLHVSRSYEVHLNLNNSGQLINVKERPVTWIHSTIMDVRDLDEFTETDDKKHLDIRTQAQTQADVAPDSDLYKFVFPDGPPGDKAILDLEKPNRPVLTSAVSFRAKASSFHLRRIEGTRIFSDGVSEAVFYQSTRYDLDTSESFTPERTVNELSLRFSAVCDHRQADVVAKNITDTIRIVTEGILDVQRK